MSGVFGSSTLLRDCTLRARGRFARRRRRWSSSCVTGSAPSYGRGIAFLQSACKGARRSRCVRLHPCSPWHRICFQLCPWPRSAALVSADAEKRRTLGRRYGVPSYGYEACEELFASGEVDAVYIGLPNHLHCPYTLLAARAGVHVLCEKPMALTALECRQMVREAADHHVKLMIAYRLHFESANLEALRIARARKLGEPRFFSSSFSMQVKPGNIRVLRESGGGTLHDIGIYCIQAARQLFGDEPIEAFAMSARGDDPRFAEVDEMTSALLRFPGGRLASFTASFGAADVSTYQLVGT